MLDRAGQEEAATQRRLVILAALLPPPVSWTSSPRWAALRRWRPSAAWSPWCGRGAQALRAGRVGHYQLGDPPRRGS